MGADRKPRTLRGNCGMASAYRATPARIGQEPGMRSLIAPSHVSTTAAEASVAMTPAHCRRPRLLPAHVISLSTWCSVGASPPDFASCRHGSTMPLHGTRDGNLRFGLASTGYDYSTPPHACASGQARRSEKVFWSAGDAGRPLPPTRHAAGSSNRVAWMKC